MGQAGRPAGRDRKMGTVRKEAEETMNAAASSMLAGGGQRQKANPYGVRACAVVRCALDDIPTLRQQLGPPGDKPFQASFLKPSDEQTVVAVAAVLEAINQH